MTSLQIRLPHQQAPALQRYRLTQAFEHQSICPEAWHRRRRRPHSLLTVHQSWVWGLFPVLEGRFVPSQPCRFRAVNLPSSSQLHATLKDKCILQFCKDLSLLAQALRRRTSLKSYWRLPCVSFQQLILRRIYAPFAPSSALRTYPISSQVVRLPCRRIGRRCNAVLC